MNGASALQKEEHVFGHGHTRPEACKREATRSRECNAQRRPGLGNHPPVMCRLVDQQDHGVDRPIALLQVETSKECLEVVQASLGLDPEPPIGPLDDEVPCSLVVPAGGVAPAAAGVPVAADCNRYDGDFVAQDQGWRKQSRESSLKGEVGRIPNRRAARIGPSPQVTTNYRQELRDPQHADISRLAPTDARDLIV